MNDPNPHHGGQHELTEEEAAKNAAGSSADHWTTFLIKQFRSGKRKMMFPVGSIRLDRKGK